MGVATQPGRRPEPRLGRKHDQSRTEAILAATRTLLLEQGYDSFRIQDVAERAEAGVGAIYRRWPNKESLVAEAIRTGSEPTYEKSDDPEADLTNLVRARAELASSHPDLVPGLVSAMRASPEISHAMRHRHTTEPYRKILVRLLGADHPHLDLVSELAPALVVHRTIFGEARLDPEPFSEEVVALIRALAAKPSV